MERRRRKNMYEYLARMGYIKNGSRGQGHLGRVDHMGIWAHFSEKFCKVARVTRVDSKPIVGSVSLLRPLVYWNDYMTDMIKPHDVPLIWYFMLSLHAWYYVIACHICIPPCIGLGDYNVQKKCTERPRA